AHVSRKIHLWFINGIIPYPLYKQHKYRETVDKCEILLGYIRDRAVRIQILKYSCFARHSLSDFKGLLVDARALKEAGYTDKYVEQYLSVAEERVRTSES